MDEIERFASRANSFLVPRGSSRYLPQQKDLQWKDINDSSWDDVGMADEAWYEEDRGEDPPPKEAIERVVDHSVPPEGIALLLPSTFGRAQCKADGLEEYAELEIALRQGQCNDQLHKCRIACGHKSFIYRSGIRHAQTYREKGRSHDELFGVDIKLAQHARCYRSARRALVDLDAPGPVLAKYRELQREDLKASTAIVDPNMRGQRSNKLPWIWTVQSETKEEKEAWEEESLLFSSHIGADRSTDYLVHSGTDALVEEQCTCGAKH